MIWIGLVLGVVVGGLIWGLEGAVTLGFLGWLAGLIIQSNRRAATAVPAAASAPARKETLDERVGRLEKVVARLEARLGVVPDAAVAAMVGDPITSVPEIASPSVVADAAPVTTTEPEPVPAPSEPPPPPSPPNPVIAWITGGNTIARIGLLILFFGFAFLLKYAADNEMLPPEVRVGGVAVGAIVLLVLGWRLRARNEAFALGLQGAGVAVLYLTTFAALRLYHLIPPEAAFILLAAIAIFSAILAVVQNAVALAVIGAGGGFLAPVLASSGGGSHVMLFGYYLVLNLGIAVIAYYRAWRALNLTGFLFTFFIGLAWGERYYRPEHFATTEPFLIAFFLVFVGIAILVAREKISARPGSEQGQSGVRPGFLRYVDGTLVFGVPLAAFGLQAGLMKETEYGLAFTSLAAAAFYLALAWGLLRTKRESWTLLAQSFIALGVVFVTLAIPLALDARWTSASWALEGAAIVWIGLRQDRRIARAFGILLQLAAGIAYFEGYRRVSGGPPLVDAAFVGAVLIALAGLWTHRLLLKAGETVTSLERGLTVPLFVWGLAWTLFAGLDEIDSHIPGDDALAAAVLFLAATALVFGVLARRWAWTEAGWAARAVVPALWVAAVVVIDDQPHPLGNFGWIAWPLAFAALAWILRRVEPAKQGGYTTVLHAGAWLLLAALGAKELHWIAATYTARGTAWSVAAVATFPALLMLIASARTVDTRWPFAEHARAYRYHAALVLALAFAAWSLYANVTHDARSDPLPYLPLLNALDLAHGLVIMAVMAAWLAMRRSGLEPPSALRGAGGAAIAGALGFVWLNGILLRTLSHWAEIPYTLPALSRSTLVQASLSVFWALIALAIMVFATRTSRRPLWMAGVVLMGVVVVKLFLFDLAHVGRIEQIVSFIAVGVLMLVIGYFSPLPPRKLEKP